jgi:long-chain acyl-CoA synthetase
MTTEHPWLKLYPKNIDWNAQIKLTPLHDLLADTVEKHHHRPAFDFLGHKYTWGQIGDMVDHLAKGLQNLGYKKGDRIGLLLPNCPMFVVAYYAIARMGGIIVNFNPLYAERELANQVNDSGIALMITVDLKLMHDKLIKVLPHTGLTKILVCPFAAQLPFPQSLLFPIFKSSLVASIPRDDVHIRLDAVMANDGRPAKVEIDPVNDVALLQYTGGTTGIPKGAMLTHANIVANTRQCGMWFVDCQEGREKMLGVIPFFHVFAMTAVMNLSVLKGLEIIAIPRFDLNDTMKVIHRKKPTLFPAVPAIFNAIVHHPQLKQYDLTSLRHCISGGAPLPVEVKKEFEDLTGCVLVEGYGLTETSPVTHVNPLHGVNKAGSIGLPVPGTDVRLVSLEDRKTPVAMGQKGELCIRGPQVMKGYWNKPDDTTDVIDADGWLHTADVGIMDADGYVFIVDRIKDMIKTNGYNVYPRVVEEAIYMHPDVQECIVAGLPDHERGEKVKAWILLKADRDMSGESMKGFLRDKLSPMEIPRDIEFRDTPLPKTLIGKLSRKDIVAQELAKQA